jgi:signal transduction histidine kinase
LQTTAPSGSLRKFSIERLVRALPIRWRVFSIAALNTAAVIVLGAMIWNGAQGLTSAWEDVRQVRESDKLLALLESEAGRLQNLIHRYINQPGPELFAEILLLREAVLGTLRTRGTADPMLAGSVDALAAVTERFLDGFGDLRAMQASITSTYEQEVLRPAKEMGELYARIESAIGSRDAPILRELNRSREAFTTTLVAANVYYLSLASGAAADARRNLAVIEQSIPIMSGLAESEAQRMALQALQDRAASFRNGLSTLGEKFGTRSSLLRTAIDGNQAAMIGVIDGLSAEMRTREQHAQSSFDRALQGIYRQVVIIGLFFLAGVMIVGAITARSIRGPLRDLMSAMHAIVSGKYDREVRGTEARDEIGAMARAMAIFRDNAIARRKAEEELRAAKEKAENALAELREAQQSLIDAEKLAALGGLVAGVAHEVNTPIGMSLTVASSLAHRCKLFAAEVKEAPLRRSRLDQFVEANSEAALQLVANLQRAAELIQSFKQVAVDRSNAERRQFDLREATDQILASLRPALKKSPLALSIEIPAGIALDSYPGAFGQVLTNLCLNAATHGFPNGRTGKLCIEARQLGRNVELVVSDDGVGMAADVQRQAFNPFFTTRRNQGGTGLGLHITYNLVTQQLGGHISLQSKQGTGTTFRITLPRTAPGERPETAADGRARSHDRLETQPGTR